LVTAISTSASKEAMCKKLGATNFVLSNDEASLKAAAGSCDVILNTVSAEHELMPIVDLVGPA
jgi:D-arabinose 1-dehydrogenase-like Zn-dependent alcohol dehydrogenase